MIVHPLKGHILNISQRVIKIGERSFQDRSLRQNGVSPDLQSLLLYKLNST